MTDKSQSTTSENDTSIDVAEAVLIEATTKPETPVEKPKDKPEKKPAKTGLLWFFVFINFVLVVLLCAAAYWYYTQIAGGETNTERAITSLEQKTSDQADASQNAINKLQQKQQSISRSVDDISQTTKQALTNIQNGLDYNTQTSNALAKQLAEMSGRRPSDWLLAEANYLVNMAARKLYLEKNIRTAMTLLSEADARLADLNEPSLFSVRALIAADIQTLKQINPVSTNSIALALAGMLPKVSELPLDKLQLPENANDQDLTLSEDVSDWQTNLSLTWDAIVGDLISIDYVDEPLEPYLAERQQWLIEQQLKHSITQAQTAALNEQVDLYRSSMQQAIGLLQEHYQLDNSQVNQFLVTLEELQNMDFSRNYPNELSSLASLKELLERRIQNLFNNSTAPQVDNSGNQL